MRRRALIIPIVVLFASACAWLALRSVNPEPAYQGQSLRHWTKMMSYMTSDPNDPMHNSYWVGDKPMLEIGPGAIPFLIKTLRKPDSRFNALYVSVWPKLPRIIQKHLPEPCDRASMRDNAARALELFGPQASSSAPYLMTAMEDSNKWVRSSSAKALGAIGPGARVAVPMLIRGLKDPDANMRLACLIGLNGAGCDSPEALSEYEQSLADKDPNTRAWAVSGLGRMTVNRPAAVEALKGALQDDAGNVRIHAAEALGRFGPSASNAVPALLKQLELEEQQARTSGTAASEWYYIEALRGIGAAAGEAVPALTNLMGVGSANDAVAAARALWAIEPHNSLTIPCLTTNLKTGPAALRALGEIGREARNALPQVEAYLGNNDLDIRMEATVAAWKIQPSGSPPLELLVNTYLAKVHPTIQRHALELLGELGPAARDATSTLVEATKDRDALTRSIAAEALKKVRGENRRQ